MKTINISFDNDEAANHFMNWLANQGEQYYWMWMKCCEKEESGNITAIQFNYFANFSIETECSRLTK